MKKTYEEKCPIRKKAVFDKSNDQLTINDCLTIRLNTETLERVVEFPYLLTCPTCHSYVGFVVPGGRTVPRADLAYSMALIMHGMKIKTYDNSAPDGQCSCQEQLLQLQKWVQNLPLESEGPWVGKQGGRAITDYSKTVQFGRSMSADEVKKFAHFLQLNSCPGWTKVVAKQIGDYTYQFSTTDDRSD